MYTYATREQIESSLESIGRYRSKQLIDAKLGASRIAIDNFLHRGFLPELRSIGIDWPNYTFTDTWEIDLGDNTLVSLTALNAGGNNIPPASVLLRRGDDRLEPPYESLEIGLASGYALTSGSTFQKAVTITGLFGHNDTDVSVPASALLSGGINSSVTTLTLIPAAGNYDVGCGSIVKIGTERIVLLDRRLVDTGQNTAGGLDDLQSDNSLPVADGTAFAVDEIILVDTEYMRIADIAGNTLIVERAVFGSTLTLHGTNSDIYAKRTWLVQRGALGTTAAAHTNGDSAWSHQFPALVNELAVAETVVLLEQNAAGYARLVGSGQSSREATGQGLIDLRAQAWTAYGRKSRLRTV